MATTLPPNDPARQALQKKDEILAALDAMTKPPATETAEPAPAPEPAPETTPSIPFEKRMEYFRGMFNDAFDTADADALRRIAAEAKGVIAEELAERERQLQAAKDYFDAQVKDAGADSPQTQEAAQLVREWQQAVDLIRAENEDVEQFDAEAAIASFQKPEVPSAVGIPAVAAETRPSGTAERPVTLEGLKETMKHLDTLREELQRLRKEVEIRIAKAEIGI